jgi:hypothetical protein
MWWIIVTIIVLFVFIKLYNRLKHPFWSKQPVLYIAPISINWYNKKEFTLITETNNLTPNPNVKTISMTDIKSTDYLDELIKLHYIDPEKQRFTFSIKDWIEEHTTSIVYPSLISLYEPDGMILSKSGYFRRTNIFERIYSVDWLAVRSTKRKKGLANALIETHAYDVWNHYGCICPILFKREGHMSPIIPFVEYTSQLYSIDGWKAYKPTGMMQYQNLY